MDRIDPKDIGHDFLEAVGLLAIEWTRTEELVGDCARRILGLERVDGWAAVTHIPLRQRFDIILSILSVHGASDFDWVADLKRCINDIYDVLRVERNDFIHGIVERFGVGEATVGMSIGFTQVTRSARKKLNIDRKPLSTPAINDLIQRICAARNTFETIGDRAVKYITSL